MKKLFGGPGTLCGLLLRIGQCASAAASIGVMVSAKDFSVHTAFCYLIASMGLQLLWSFGLACLDVYALRSKKDLQNPILVSLFVVGDWVTAMLSLAAACSSAGVVVLYEKDIKYCNTQSQYPCLSVQKLLFETWNQFYLVCYCGLPVAISRNFKKKYVVRIVLLLGALHCHKILSQGA